MQPTNPTIGQSPASPILAGCFYQRAGPTQERPLNVSLCRTQRKSGDWEQEDAHNPERRAQKGACFRSNIFLALI